jgi:DNA repair protein RecO (recombination protein O)
MSTEKSEGLIVRLADFSETSKVVTLFTRDFGKISAIAKGAKRLKGPFEIALDLLVRCEIVFIRKSAGLDILTEARLVSRFRPNGRDMTSLYGGYYVAELLSGLTEDHDPHRILYDEAVSTLEHLAAGESPRLSVVRFELTVLREIGQLPALDDCVACGRPVDESSSYALWVSQGGLICRACQKEKYQPQSTFVPAGSVALLRRLARPETDPKRLIVTDQQMRQMRQVTVAALSHALGRRPKMLRYLQS